MTDLVEGIAPATPRTPKGLLRRLVTYSLGSVVAATCGELAFIAVYGWLAAGNVAASAAGFVGGAVPNYIVNRRWVWGDRRGRRPRSESLLYWTVALCSFGASVEVTDRAEDWARSLTDDRAWRVLLVAGAYLAVAGVFFVVKFVLFHFLVFTGAGPTTTGPTTTGPTTTGPAVAAAPDGQSDAPTTTS